MRKFLIAIVTVLILVLAFFFIRDGLNLDGLNLGGLNLGGFQVLGIFGIQELDEELNKKLKTAEELTQSKFKQINDELNIALTKTVTLREDYERMLQQTDSDDISEILKTEKYEVEKLWITIGNYADEHKVKVNLQITNSSVGVEGVKDLNFTVNGSYVGITDFIYDLEDDEELQFKIENFNMMQDSTNSNIKATFTVKDVNVNIATITETPTNNDDAVN